MKVGQTHNDDESLRRVLHQWAVDIPLPPRFQEQVWGRIAQTETQPVLSLWGSLSGWVEGLLSRPHFALSYFAALLVLGVAAGSLAAQVTTRRLNANLGVRYVQSLDPFRTDTPHR